MDSRRIRLLVTEQSRNCSFAGWHVVWWIYSRQIAIDCRQINSGAPNYLALPQNLKLKNKGISDRRQKKTQNHGIC